MTNFHANQHGAFSVLKAVGPQRTASLRLPNLRPLQPHEADRFAALLHLQSDVVARLCCDALEAARLLQGGLLRGHEAAQLHCVDVLDASGRRFIPAGYEQGRARLEAVLRREADLVRLTGVYGASEAYWIFTDGGLKRYVGGIKVPVVEAASLRGLLYGS